MKRHKITVVGAGNVGGTAAQRLVEKGFADVVLVDLVGEIARGKGLDIAEAAPLYPADVAIVGTGNYEDTAESDLVIITAGVPRKPEMSRDQLLSVNAGIVREVTTQVIKRSPQSILIVVSNPLDAMTYVAYRVSGFPKERVMGMAGVLDSARLASFIARELHCSAEDVHTLVLGGHGDNMVPLLRYTTVAGVPITRFLPRERLQALVQRTRDGGGEIVTLLKTGSAYYAPAAAVVEMASSIIQNKNKILPCSVFCEGEYGINGLFIGVPAKLGRRGVEEIIEVELTKEEREAFKKSVAVVEELTKGVEKYLI